MLGYIISIVVDSHTLLWLSRPESHCTFGNLDAEYVVHTTAFRDRTRLRQHVEWQLRLDRQHGGCCVLDLF